MSKEWENREVMTWAVRTVRDLGLVVTGINLDDMTFQVRIPTKKVATRHMEGKRNAKSVGNQ